MTTVKEDDATSSRILNQLRSCLGFSLFLYLLCIVFWILLMNNDERRGQKQGQGKTREGFVLVSIVASLFVSSCPSSAADFTFRFSGGPGGTFLVYFAHALDALSYCFLPLVFSYLLRLIQGRQLLARLGKRYAESLASFSWHGVMHGQPSACR